MKTPTPTITVESTFATPPFLSGWVGTVKADGTKVPEVGAYIYIYMDGFLLNPPSFDEDGKYNSPIQVFSDSTGVWKAVGISDNISLIFMNRGGIVTVQAKTRHKDISYLSTPYVVQGMVTPIELGVTGDFGEFRPPKDGEFILMGRLSYWYPDISIKNNNRLLVYNNGYLLGEVQSNKILGYDAPWPIQTSTNDLRFSLLVNGDIVTIPISQINIQNTAVITPPVPDGTTTIFTFPVRSITSSFIVYKNLRTNNFSSSNPMTDYSITIDPTTKLATLTFIVAPEIADFVIIYEVSPNDTYFNGILVGQQDGINTAFTFVNNPEVTSIQVFQNGLHLNGGTDLISQTTTDYEVLYDASQNRYNINFRVAPEETDVILVDYQPIGAATTTLFNPTIIPVSSTTFTLPSLTFEGNINVYKNGILQKEFTTTSTTGTYTITDNTTDLTLTFFVGEIFIDDIITVTYQYLPLYVETLAGGLNLSTFFIDNDLTAAFVDVNGINQLQISSGYPLELVLPPLSAEELGTYRMLFGSRYTLDPGKDTDGEYLYYLKADSGEWKYSNLDLVTRKPIPFNRGEHLQVRAIHPKIVTSHISETVVVKDAFHQRYLYDYVPYCVKDIKDV